MFISCFAVISTELSQVWVTTPNNTCWGGGFFFSWEVQLLTLRSAHEDFGVWLGWGLLLLFFHKGSEGTVHWSLVWVSFVFTATLKLFWPCKPSASALLVLGSLVVLLAGWFLLISLYFQWGSHLSALSEAERQRLGGEVWSQWRRWVWVGSGETETSRMNQTFEAGWVHLFWV